MNYIEKLIKDEEARKCIENMKCSAGWSFIEEYLRLSENRLNKKIITAEVAEIDKIRGALGFIKSFKKFLLIKEMSGLEAHKELERYINQM